MSTPNADLPILDELGTEFATLIDAAYAEPDRHTARRRLAPSPAGHAGRAQARRISRRAAILLVLICLVGGAAYAALRGSDGDPGSFHTAPSLLGRASNGAWDFSAYRDEGRLCTVFIPRGGELSGSCGAPPGRARVRAGSAVAGGRRYVFGVAGAGVKRVSVVVPARTAWGARALAAAGGVAAPTDPRSAADAGFPVEDGWFVLDLGPVATGGRPGLPAVVTPRDAGGRRIGPRYVDCSLGIIGAACKRRIEAAASGGETREAHWLRVVRTRDCVHPVNI